MKKEKWAPVPEYEEYYMVSTLGRVLSLKKNILLKPNMVYGYYTVGLNKDGQQKDKRVHRLVAKAFIKNDGNKPCVNHLDSNRANNNVENLEWVTHAENTMHAYKKGRLHNLPALSGSQHPQATIEEWQAKAIIRMILAGMSTYDIRTRLGVSEMVVRNIKTGTTWKHLERKHEMICGTCKKGIMLWEDAHNVRDGGGVTFVHTQCLNGRTPFKSLPPIADKPDVKHEQHHSDR